VTYGNGEPDVVVWVEGSFAFRLQATTADHGEHLDGAMGLVEQLSSVDQAQWVDDVSTTDGNRVLQIEPPTFEERLVIIMFFLLGAAFLVMMVIPAIKILKDNYS